MEQEENGLLNIHVTICDRPYRLKVKPEEEENVRKAAKHITEKVRHFQDQFAGKDKQDYLAMTALMLAVETMNRPDPKPKDDTTLTGELAQLDQMIQKALRAQS